MDDVTLGELTRSLSRLEVSQQAQTVKLDEIKEQTAKTNGYVGRHEERLNGLDREVRDLKQGRRGTHEMKRATDRADAVTVSIPINTKTILAIIASLITIAMAGWKAGLFQ